MAKQTTAAGQGASQGNEQSFEDILLLLDKAGKDLRAITKLDENGAHETAPFDPDQAKENNSFLKIDKQSSWIGNLWDNLVSQFKDPTLLNLISMKEGELDDPKLKKALKDLAAGKETKAVKEFLEKYEIRAKSPEQAAEDKIDWKALEKMGITREGLEKSGMLGAFLRQAAGEEVKVQETAPPTYKYSESLINWPEYEKLGISKEMLVQRGLLDQLLKGYKTDQLVPLRLNYGPAYIRMEARLSLMPDAGGHRLYINGVKSAPDLNNAFMGHIFSEDDKHNLRESGNMGRAVELRGRDGQYYDALVSLDKLTNDIVAVKTENVYINDMIRGVKLTPEEIADLKAGKAVYLEGMQANSGKEFNAHVQYNADKRGIEYIFENNKLFNAQKLGGVEITEKMREDINAGKAVLIENMVGKTNGELYDRYVKLDEATGQLTFNKYNPDSPEDARQVIIPKELGTVRLTTEDRETLAQGKPIYMENMTFRNSAEEQSRWVKLDLRNGDVAYSKTVDGFEERQALKVPQEVNGAQLSAGQRAQLQDGKAVLIDGIKGFDGKTISQYGKMNNVTGKIDLYNDNPDRKRDAARRNAVAQNQNQNQSQDKKKSRGVQ